MEGMDPYSEDLNLQNKGYVTDLSSNELSSLDRDHEEAQPHFGVDEPLEVQLRFELGSLVDTHVLIDTEGARESHWDFVRQEQGSFQASSHENNALLSHGKQDDLKSFDNCEGWPRSASQVDSQLFIDAQDDVRMITEAFGGKDKSMADLVEDDRGLLLSSTYRQCQEETAWIGQAKEGLEGKAHNFCRESVADGAKEASVKILDGRVAGEGESHQSQADEDRENHEARHSAVDIAKEPLRCAEQSCEVEAASLTVCKSESIVLAVSSEEANRVEKRLPECSMMEPTQPELSSIDDVGVLAQAEQVDPKEEVDQPVDDVQLLCISEEEPKMDTVGSKIEEEANVGDKMLSTVSESVEMESDLELVSRTSLAQESREGCTSADVLEETTCVVSDTGKNFFSPGGSSLDNTPGGSCLESESGLADQVEKQSALKILATEVDSKIEGAEGVAGDNVSVSKGSQETTVLSILEASRADDNVVGKAIASCEELERPDEGSGQTASKLAVIEPEDNSLAAATIAAMPAELHGVCSMAPTHVLEQGGSHESGTEVLENKKPVSSLEQAETMQGILIAADFSAVKIHPSHEDIALRHASSSDGHGDLEAAGNNMDFRKEGKVDPNPTVDLSNVDLSSKEHIEAQDASEDEQLANDGSGNESIQQEQKLKQHNGEEYAIDSTLSSAKPSLSNESKFSTEVSHPDGILHVLLDVHKEAITDDTLPKNAPDKGILKTIEGEGLVDVQTSNTGDAKVAEGCSDTYLSGSVRQVAVSGSQEDATPSQENSGKRKTDSSTRNNRLKDSARASLLQVRSDQEQKNVGTEGLGRRKSTPKTPAQKKGADPSEGFASPKKAGSKNIPGRRKGVSAMVHDAEASLGATEGSQTRAIIGKTALSVNARHHGSPDLNGLEVAVPMIPPSQPFSEPQQVQLRAQILVYGSLIQGAAPEEALMAAAFSNVTGVEVGSAPEASGRAVWEKQWQTAVDRIRAKTSCDTFKDSSRANTALVSNSPVTTAKAAEGGLKPNGSPGMANIVSAAAPPARASDVSCLKGQASRPKQPSDSAHDISVGRSNQTVVAAAPLGPITSTASRATPSISESFIQPAKPRADSQPITPQSYFPPPPLGPFIPGAPQWFSNTSFPGSWMPHTQAAAFNNPPALFTHPQAVVSSDLMPETRRSTPSSSGTLMPASSFGPTLFPPVVGAMSVTPTPIADPLQNKQPVSESRPRKRKKTHSESYVPSADVNPFYAPTLVASHMPTGQASLGIASPVYSPPPTASEALALVVANTQMPKFSPETSLVAGHANKVSAPSSTIMTNAGPPSVVEKTVSLQDPTNHLSQAQASAEEAASVAASAIRESESLWSRLKVKKSAGLAPDIESQLVSSAYAMAAAASVAKAAAAAAKAAYEAAVQAKRISEGVLEGGKQAHDALSSRLLGDKADGSSEAWGMPESCNSVLAAAKMASKQRLEAASASRVRAENFESVVRAAELATNAITQVGCVMAMGESVPFTLDMLLDAGPEGLHRLEDKVKTKPRVTALRSPSRAGTPKSVERERKFPSKITSGKEVTSQRDGQLDSRAADSSMSVRSEIDARNNTELGVGLLTDFSKQKSTDHLAPSMPASRSLLTPRTEGGLMEQEALVADNNIAKGSIVEVMSDEKGLRGVWFSARVQSVDDEKVFVLYDDLLADDGYSPLEEWIQLKGSFGKAPRVRRAHPSTNIGFEGTRKRRREAMGSHKWSVGDRVDAWIRDGWWEGEIKEIIEDGESKAKVFFPGDGDTSIVKTSKLRPSLLWSNGHWVLWTDAKQGKKESSRARTDSHEGDTPLAKRHRTEKAQASVPLKQKLVPGSAADSSATHKEASFLDSNTADLPTDFKGFTTDAIAKPKLQGSRVVFGVPRPTKKRKLIEVSKHFGSAKGVSSTGTSDVKAANNKSEGALVYAPGSSDTSKLDVSKAKKRALHLPKVRPQKGTDLDVKASTIRSNKEKSVVATKTLVRKNVPSKGGFSSISKSKEGKVVKPKNVPSAGNIQLESQEQDRAPSSIAETHTSSIADENVGKESSLARQKDEKLNDAGKESGTEPSQAAQENEKAKQSSQQVKDNEVPSSAPATGNKSTFQSLKKKDIQPSKDNEEVPHKVKGSESQPTQEGEKQVEVLNEKEPAALVNHGEKESSFHPTKESEKSKEVGKPASETWEPRRTSRKMQPTSKLLEGLQTAPKLGKNSSSHDRGSRGGSKAPPQP